MRASQVPHTVIIAALWAYLASSPQLPALRDFLPSSPVRYTIWRESHKSLHLSLSHQSHILNRRIKFAWPTARQPILLATYQPFEGTKDLVNIKHQSLFKIFETGVEED